MTYGTVELDRSSRPALIGSADAYLQSREGYYSWRSVRYDAALSAMREMIHPSTWVQSPVWAQHLSREMTVCDVGAGMTEFGRRMYETGWQYRYWPVDGAFDGTDLNHWSPPREADFFVALELLEHLYDPAALVEVMQRAARLGIVVSTPNPRTTDVLGMDRTHHTAVSAAMLEAWGFTVREVSFYGSPADTLFATWRPSR